MSPPGNDFLYLLGAERLGLDPDELVARYHRLAREHHVDRGGDPAASMRLARAYRTLKDPIERIRHLLACHDEPIPPLRPSKLAADYFELREAIEEGREADRPGFERLVQEAIEEATARRVDLEAAHDAAGDRAPIRRQLAGWLGEFLSLRALLDDLKTLETC